MLTLRAKFDHGAPHPGRRSAPPVHRPVAPPRSVTPRAKRGSGRQPAPGPTEEPAGGRTSGEHGFEGVVEKDRAGRQNLVAGRQFVAVEG